MITNWIANSKMKNLLNDISACTNTENLTLNLHQLKSLLSPSLKKVRDCIIISEKSIDKLGASFDKIIKTYTDRTGYEASNTETRINDYFQNDISMITGTQIALIVLNIWALQLKQIEFTSKFCLILCVDENHVEIRFHKIHHGESMWLEENLECYKDGAVGYVII